jgi:hypothetical protein
MDMLKRNIGGTDQTIRLLAGIALLSIIAIFENGWQWIGLIGLVPFLTALFRWCPHYHLLGINSCEKEVKHV